VHVEGNSSLKADFDEDRIVQVVTNLVSNAIKFCPDNNGLITLAVYDKHDFVQVEVSDNGKGIAPNDLEIIFDKFYQSTNQNFKKPIGSGLGLAICKQIIEHHKGKIWAANNATGGACLSFTVPKKQQP
jgi:signal transduction histidine kinase